MNLNSLKEWCTCGYCSVMSTNRECLCCREIDGIVSKKLSDGILIYAIHSHVKPLDILSNFRISKFHFSNSIPGSCSKDTNFIADIFL